MTNLHNISQTEEFDIVRKIQFPHTLTQASLSDKASLAFYILSLKNTDILLLSSLALNTTSVFAGLSAQQIEYLVKNTPIEYKKEIADLLSNNYEMKEIFEIAVAMDKYLGENITQNQERVKNVIQYIKDNRIAFEFLSEPHDFH